MENEELKMIFKELAKTILVYPAKTEETDQGEHTKSVKMLNGIPIMALVTDLVSSQVVWKMPGITTESAKIVVIEKDDRSLIENSYKIGIDGVDYVGWKDNSGKKIQMREVGEFVAIYVYTE